MPFDANGNFSVIAGTIVSSGQTIQPSQHNPFVNDTANGLSQVMVRDGRAPATGNWNMGGNKITGLADGTAPGDAATVGQAASVVGDFKETVNVLDSNWLRRNGALYDSATYPELAALLPALPDGVAWTNTNAITTGTVRKVQRTATGYLMMVDDGSSATKVFTASASADDWSQVATITGFRVWDFVLEAGVYVAVDGTGKVSRSTDGSTWTTPTAVLTFAAFAGIAFAFGLFVAVGDGGKIATSPDGVTWTARTSGTAQFLFKVKLVNGVLVAVGGNGVILSSTDGINWTSRTSGVTAQLNDVVFGDGLYVVVGAAGAILTSPTLVTWTPRTSGTTSALNAITYSTSGFLAAGNDGTVRISTNATSWAASITGTSIAFTFAGFDADNQARYFVGGNGALYIGVRTLPTQFRVPNDDPTYGWIKAVS